MNPQSKKNMFKTLSLAIIIAAVLAFFFINNIINSAPWGSPNNYTLEVKPGSTFKTIAAELSDKKVIQNEFFFLRQAGSISYPANGKYELKLPANSQSVIDQIDTQSKAIIEDGKVVTFKFLIKEGETIDDIIKNFVKIGSTNQEFATQYFSNYANFDRSVLTYLPPALGCAYGNISNCAKYPVEGYIYPATYELDKKGTFQDHVFKILETTQRKWKTLAKQPTYADIIMASVVEKESGYGSRDRNSQAVKDILKNERQTIVTVLNNRNETGMKWQLNPTTTYGTDYKLCETTINIPNCKSLDDRAISSNIYNTYINAKPIGPISNPSIECIEAVMNPSKNNYLFFIADKNGATRFADTFDQFLKIEQDIINER
jgi:UPF0755 protein